MIRNGMHVLTGAGLAVFLLGTLMPAAPANEEKNRAQEALEKRQKAEILGFFLKDPAEAKMPQTTLAIDLYNMGVELYEKREYDLALSAFQDSLEYNPQNALAHELIGDIHYFQQRLPEAKKNYQEAFRLQPREGLKKKIEKLRDETKVEKNLSTYLERHFIIKYRRENKQYDGFELRDLLRETYKNISQDFGYYFKEKVVVLLYDQEEFRQLTELPHWVAGVYDGKIRMPAYKEGFSEKEMRALTAHEMTHAFVADLSRMRAPVWINEGLAEFQENRVEKNKLIVFKSAVKTGNLIPIDQLMSVGGATAMKDPLLISLFYEQSFHLVSYLVDRYGMFRVKQLLEEFGKGRNSDEALRNVLKISPARLEKEWKATF